MSLKTSRSVDQAVNESSASLSSLGIVPFGFHAKITHDAAQSLLQVRSDNFQLLPFINDDDIWKRQAPDFRHIIYEPNPPKRNTIESIRPWEYGTISGRREIIKKNESKVSLPLILKQKDKEKNIITSFHIDRPFTAKKKFVSHGMYKPSKYENPKPHDFRQYPSLKTLGLEEFVTRYERDPYNLRFRSQRLNHIYGSPSEPSQRDIIKDHQMAPTVSPRKMWEAHLVLEKDMWPPRSAAFTRHRRRHRQPYSAFMELVDRTLTAQWSKEKWEKHIQQSRT